MLIRNLSSATRLLVVLAVAVGAAACDIVVGGLNARETAKDTWQRTFQLPASGRFELVNSNGRVEIEAVDGESIEVVAERTAGASTLDAAKDLLKQIEIQVEQPSGSVKITTKTPRGYGSHAEVKYRVKLPRLAAVQVKTANGGVKVTGVRGAVQAESTNGTVTATSLGGPVVARTTNGSLEIEVDEVTGEGIRLETTNGSIELRLPKTAKAELRARAVNGSVRTSDLELESSGQQSRRQIVARLNGGGSTIEVKTVNGGINIVGR